MLAWICVWQQLWLRQDLGVLLPSPDIAWNAPRESRSLGGRGGRQYVRGNRARHGRERHWLGSFVVYAAITLRLLAGR
jgi:hypothetical protein